MKSFILMALLLAGISHAQHTPKQWVFGPGISNNFLDFSGSTLNISSCSPAPNFAFASAGIGSADSSLRFYTNGLSIYNRQHQKIIDGDVFTGNPNYVKTYVDAITFLPHPGDTGKTYIIQQAIDSTTTCPNISLSVAMLQLRYSIIDNNANNGQGAIISKHNVLLNAAFNMGILAIKHGNGRDWWIIVHRFNMNLFQRFLLTPNGITGPTAQYYGTARCTPYWSWRYSPLTQKVVGFKGDWIYPTTRYIDVFDFDRCTGLFSNQQLITINNYLALPYSGSCEISPNGRFLYAGVMDELYQFDLTASNIQASAVVVDTLDSINFWSLYKSWFLMQTAPDGKIYGVSFFGDTFLNVIHYPDSAGLACMAVAKGISLPGYPNKALPHTPLYELGPLPGSACDTLTAIAEPVPKNKLLLYPNPANKWLMVNDKWLNGLPFTLTVYDVLGKMHLMQNTNASTIDISTLTPGLYVLCLQQGDKMYYGRFVKE